MPERPIISSWNTKEEVLKQQAVKHKENANVAVDRWRNKDHCWTLWAEHKRIGVPFGRANLMFILQILKLFRLWPTYFLNFIPHCRQKSVIDLNVTTYGTFINQHWKVQYKSAEFGNLVTKSSGGMYRGVNLLKLFFNSYILVKQGWYHILSSNLEKNWIITPPYWDIQ